MTNLPMSATTPISVSGVGLKARNGDALANYYQDLLGLEELTRQDNAIVLGAAGYPLLTIEEDRSLKPDDPREAGLFHTAFLFPERADLARWTQRAIERRIAIEGASDHLVSEAVYLTDPEGNGIEIYTDRSSDVWQWEGNEVVMKTLPLDFNDLLATPGASEPYQAAPHGTVIGHVHLRVGDPIIADRWWREEFGLDTMAKYGPQAVFLSSGGYHHHIGANSWRSAGAGQRDESRSGLAWIAMKVPADTAEAAVQDPWGTTIRKVHG